MRRYLRAGSIAVLVMTLMVSLVSAIPVEAGFYGELEGSTVVFSEINDTTHSTGDPDGLFGGWFGPTNWGDSLLFSPNAYASMTLSVPDAVDSTSSTLQMMLVSKPGYTIETIRIEEYGWYGLLGNGATALASGYLTVTDLSGTNEVATVFNNDRFDLSPGVDTFQLAWEIEFAGWEMTAALFSFSNNLETTGGPGATAFIQNNVTRISLQSGVQDSSPMNIVTTPVPIPATFWLVGSALGPLCWLRRRSTMAQKSIGQQLKTA